MSFFSGKAFAGSSYAAKPAANDPASEIQRLLASYANHWCSLEKEIKETKAKQGQAQQAYHTAVQELHSAKESLMRSEEGLAGALAECEHAGQEVEAKQAINEKIMKEVTALKGKVDQMKMLSDAARAALSEQCQQLMEELRALQRNKPDCFFRSYSEA